MVDTNLLNKRQKARELNISVRTLDRWVKEEKLDIVRIPGDKLKRVWFLPLEVDDYD